MNMFENLIDHIIEQRNKQQYINALATVTELQTLLLREFSDLQKGKPANTGLQADTQGSQATSPSSSPSSPPLVAAGRESDAERDDRTIA